MREFAAHGYKSASLREIAKRAGCSLTLLVHHFGNKAGLVAAAVQSLQTSCELRIGTLRTRLAIAGLDFQQLAQAWADHEFEQHTTREGKLYLDVMLRLQADREISDDLRQVLDCSAPVVRRGLQRACPAMDDDMRQELWHIASAALYEAVVRLEQIRETSSLEAIATLRKRAVSFLVSGLHGYCVDTAG